MEFSDITTYLPTKYLEFEVETEDPDEFNAGDYVRISSLSEDNDAYISKINDEDSSYECHFVNRKYKYSFEDNSKGAYYCQITGKRKNLLSVLMVYDLVFKYEDDFNSNGIVIAALESALKEISVADLNQILSSNYCLEIGDDDFYVIARNINSKKENNFLLVDMTHGKALSVTSKLFAEIDTENGDTSNSSYVIESSERPFVNKDNYSFVFYKGSVRFEDKTKLHRLEEITKGFITDGGNPYVNAWRLYAEKQFALEMKNHDDAGIIHFTKGQTTKEGVISFSVNNEDSVINFLQKARKENGNINVVITQTPKNSSRPMFFKAIMSDKYIPGTHAIDCSIDNDDRLNYGMPGDIETDISGCKTVYERRIQAFNSIQSGQSANGALTYLLDGKTVNNYSNKDLNDSIKLDERIIAQYFDKFPPNPSQRRAIEIAVKTPDFAVIQGPPGTGKTKVIKTIHALLEYSAYV